MSTVFSKFDSDFVGRFLSVCRIWEYNLHYCDYWKWLIIFVWQKQGGSQNGQRRWGLVLLILVIKVICIFVVMLNSHFVFVWCMCSDNHSMACGCHCWYILNYQR